MKVSARILIWEENMEDIITKIVMMILPIYIVVMVMMSSIKINGESFRNNESEMVN